MVTTKAGQCGDSPAADRKICEALAAQAAGRFAEAASGFENAASALKPGDPAADRMLAAAGNMWIAAGDPAKAAAALDKGLAGSGLLAEQRGEALLDRARAAEAQGDLQTARAKVTAASETISKDPFLWYFSAALAIREKGDEPCSDVSTCACWLEWCICAPRGTRGPARRRPIASKS